MIKSAQIPLASPRLSPEDIQAVSKILQSGQLVCGPKVEEFERGLAAYLGVQYAVCVSSGTAALHLGLLALGIGAGHDVIVPAFSFPATANVVELTGARPIFVDSEPDGFNIDTSMIENRITPATKAIIIVHNFGWPVRMDRVEGIAAKYNLSVFEDAACALGSTYNGVRCGAFGDLAAFSFHPRKILTTGEGGAISTNNPDIASKALELRNHGQNAVMQGQFKLAGFNYRMTDFQAALGLSQLRRYPSTLFRRKKAARYYDKNISGSDIELPRPADREIRPNYQSFVAFIEDEYRDGLIGQLMHDGIGAGIGTYSIPHTEYYSNKYRYTFSDFKNSYRAWKSLLSLPIYDGITSEEQDRVIETLMRHRKKQQPRPKAESVKI